MSKHNINHEKVYQNTNGNNIILTKNQYDLQNMSSEIIITEKNNNKLVMYFTLLLLLISINIYLFYFQYMSIYYNLIISAVIAFFIIKITSTITCEKVLFVKSLGIQISKINSTGIHSTIFIPWKSIQKIFINEVITFQRVLYLLTVLVENEQGKLVLVPLFKNIKPRLSCIEDVYNEIEGIARKSCK